MKTGAFWELGGVSDEQLRSGLVTLLASGSRTEARLIAHIAEVEERRLHSKDGCSSIVSRTQGSIGRASAVRDPERDEIVRTRAALKLN
jgi:hypothetical protein